jgi:hypothetical protein
MTGIEEILQQQDEGVENETPPESTETEKKDEAVTPEEKKDEAPVVEDAPAIPPAVDELNELRQFIREQRKEIAAMKAKLGRVKESSEVDDDGKPIVTYTPLENLQKELHNIAIARTPLLEVIVEAMEANPKYADIYEVCSKTHFDDIFEMAATTISRQEGRDFNEVLLQLELEVWKKPNPYKYMYTVIKENHPKYKGKPEPKKEEPINTAKLEEAVKASAKKVLEAKAAPGSIAAAGSGENLGTGAWTAAKIDDLEENELHQVPKEIYQKYMMGKLK